jgi:RNA polymerase II subunit A C-terminal domain phosphatase SSU72
MSKKETLRFAVVCASNQNRSMEAHKVLMQEGFNICSYGTGTMVRLPGPSIDRPNNYQFGVPYQVMYDDLYRQNKDLYTHNGILDMLDRNRKIKTAPERFQENWDEFDIVFTCEERVFDAACDGLPVNSDLLNRNSVSNSSVHLINVDIIDNRESAAVGGQLILQLANKVLILTADCFMPRY